MPEKNEKAKAAKNGRQGEGGGAPKKYTEELIEQYAEELLTWFQESKKRLWLKSFAIERGFPSENLSVFAKKNEKFAHALKIAKDIQELRLFELGIQLSKGKNKPAFAIFALKNVAGWRDTQDITSGGEKVTGLTVTIVKK